MNYEDAVRSAALSYADDLMLHGAPEEEVIRCAQEAKIELQLLIDAAPNTVQFWGPDEPYFDDWLRETLTQMHLLMGRGCDGTTDT